MNKPSQTPRSGTQLVRHRGDVLTMSLTLPEDRAGTAWLRTNLGRGSVRRMELIAHAETDQPPLARDWHDLRMQHTGPGRFQIALPLLEVGCFEAKGFFLPAESTDPVWPAGGNVGVKVEPAETCCGNSMYAAFVRQFGPERTRRHSTRKYARTLARLDRDGYTTIPPSGTFRDLVRNLDLIMGQMRFHIVQLLPIHPIPTTFGRMGRFGSPFAVQDFMDVDPALAEFDRQTTPMEQFQELVHAVHARLGKLFIDIPINHTGWASWLQVHHPEWFARNHDRTFQSPGAWGVTWADLSRLDYERDRGLWKHIAEVFLYWARRGVDGFRCDAGYMIPLPVWAYVVARVRNELPDTIFLLEGLGGSMDNVEELLCRAGLNWAYSELFQNYDRRQVQEYVPFSVRVTETKGLLVHFAETHDNNRLAARSPTYSRLRTAVSALFSQEGGFGIANGVEWFATEKIDVHGAAALNWGAEPNQVREIRILNRLLCTHPAFHADATLTMIPCQARTSVALLRQPAGGARPLLVLANLSQREADVVSWRGADTPGLEGNYVDDLLTGEKVEVSEQNGGAACALAPAQVRCLTANDTTAAPTEPDDGQDAAEHVPRRVAQCLRAKAWDVHAQFHAPADLTTAVRDLREADLARDPRAYCAAAAGDGPAPVARWDWPRDRRRTVMVPPGCFLLITANTDFVADLWDGARIAARERSLPGLGGSRFALFLPRPTPVDGHRELTLRLEVFEGAVPAVAEAPVLYLGTGQQATALTLVTPGEIDRNDTCALLANGTGAMAQVRGSWAGIDSQYDALLAANLHPAVPGDRHIMLTRCRAWLVFRGYSQAVDRHCLQSFAILGAGRVRWRFEVPCGMGKEVGLDVELELHEGRNAVSLSFIRRNVEQSGLNALEDGYAVRIVIRPDLEDRCNHATTKAYAGPEMTWPTAVGRRDNGFRFTPASGRTLDMTASAGRFAVEPEWTYMVAHPHERERGFEGLSDLFSPGYFVGELHGGTVLTLRADMGTPPAPAASSPTRMPVPHRDGPKHEPHGHAWPLKDALRHAIGDFIVRRDESLTVIAGYPWFLDWGRDTLICLRGIAAAGWQAAAREILLQFARWEENGTLPNMIRGEDASNRDTSDAPLWFLVSCADLLDTPQGHGLLDADCNGRTLRDVLLCIGQGYIRGTRNGIRMDPDSGLIFSPPHFTWMDTNHPAGTPRQGYPIEIQALWFAALRLLNRLDTAGPWADLTGRVKRSVRTLYATTDRGYLADCLHANPGQPAAAATPDDHLRPNQLLTITLGVLDDPELCRSVLAACEELLVPGAIRSLADRQVSVPLPIVWHGQALNDPRRPYWGRYQGDEDTRRKPAYHNGTAWTWLFPSYAEALVQVYGERARTMALAILASSSVLINQGCMGHVPEVVDGDCPHALRGCGAQAWGATELFRVLALVQPDA